MPKLEKSYPSKIQKNKSTLTKLLLLTYKALNDLAPNYLKELVVPYCIPRPLRSQSAGLLVIPIISKTTVGGRAFS